jgi:putative ABC transport system permease protein
MSLWQIAARNIWQSRGRYLAYLLSSGFSVMIYFLYSALIYHPELTTGYRGAGVVVSVLKAAAVVIALFTFAFLLYSNSAFVRSRMKEFGLLSLLGLSRAQLVGLILVESLAVGAVAVAVGMGLGLLFLKLFFMAISALLRLPEQIPVYAGATVWTHTLTVFGSFFVLVSLASLRSVVRQSVVELVRAGRQPKAAPTFSRGKTVLGLLLVALGYAWACVPLPTAVVLGMVPVTAMVSVGTYFLLREGSIALLAWLHGRERFFYRPGPFLNVSQLMYKMQDNYQVLTAVTLLVAVILSAVGTAGAMYAVVTGESVERTPHVVQVAMPVGDGHAAAVSQVEAVLARHGVTGLRTSHLVARKVVMAEDESEVTVVPYSFYRSVERLTGETLDLNGPDQAILVSPFVAPKAYRGPVVPHEEQVLVDGKSVTLQVVTDATGRVTNGAGEASYTLVVSDATFAQWLEGTPVEQRLQFTFWDGPAWRSRQMDRAAIELRASNPDIRALSTTVEVYHEAISGMGLTLFIAVFVSLVFFAATFSLLYFRLFTEIEEDRRYFKRLQQIGATHGEMQRLAVGQAAVIFFVPFVGGVVHATFAMRALGSLLGKSVLHYGWMVAAVYLVLYGLCFAGACAGYWRRVGAGLGAREAA